MTTTLKGTSVALGIGLAILWIAGLSSPDSPGWLTWLDGVAALAAFTIAALMRMGDSRAKRVGNTIGLSVCLFVLGIIGLATGALPWLSWWTFAFACAFLILGIAAGNIPQAERQLSEENPEFQTETHTHPEIEEERKRFRKAG